MLIVANLCRCDVVHQMLWEVDPLEYVSEVCEYLYTNIATVKYNQHLASFNHTIHINIDVDEPFSCGKFVFVQCNLFFILMLDDKIKLQHY